MSFFIIFIAHETKSVVVHDDTKSDNINDIGTHEYYLYVKGG